MLQLNPKKILVIGDFMLDVYTFGDVVRISPEAPVPVLRAKKESRKPGGAGNAILNLVSLGMEVSALGRVGNDTGGSSFLQELAKEGVDTRGVVCDPDFQTPLKNRMIAAGQQIVRIDYEETTPLNERLQQEVIDSLKRLFEKVEVIAISDYAKGFLTPKLLSEIMNLAQKMEIPVIVDPKGVDFTRYRGATLIKPNLSEAVGAARLGHEATLDDVAARILGDVDIKTLMVTRANEGISVFEKEVRRQDFPANVHEIKDVTGAGDTVLAVVTAALANGLNIGEAARLANVAAGIAIEQVGCARVSCADIALRLGYHGT